ncbi:unnamed protein product [Plutella xylostella]|uniref:(diamondback moth) hypothetical protein n=1 Tax=Plutella xylostella TaxID=51655 RepID=A0A8S4DTW4_PLUXY|nr:unnamed protein product [Plutella xylostella]
MGVKVAEDVLPPQKQSPGLFSRLFLCWMFPLFYHGNQRDLEEVDLVPSRPCYDSKLVGDQLEQKWFEEEAQAKLEGREPSYPKVLFRTFFWSYVPGGLMQFGYITFRTLSPLLFAELLSYWTVDSTMTRTTATYYTVGMVACNWSAAYLNHQGNFYCQQFGMKLRIATSTLMFRKIMRMDNGSLGETTAGKVVNLLSNDLQRFDLAFLFLHYVWIIPLQLTAVCYLGYRQAGVAALIGLAALVVIALPMQGGLGRLLGTLRMKTAEKTDARIKIMSEVINGIQVIKMYAWEIPFEKVVGARRWEEMVVVRAATRIRAVFLGFMVFTERTALFLTIVTYVLLGNTVSATVIYPLQQFMAAAQVNITLILPMVLSFTAELFVSLRRVQEFLAMKDRSDLVIKNVSGGQKKMFRKSSSQSLGEAAVRPLSYQSKSSIFGSLNVIPPDVPRRRSMSYPGELAVEVRDVSCSWVGDANLLALKNVSVRLARGKLCAIIGAVGSGKSSFLQLLLKELPAASGTVSIFGKISYACQEAWLFPNTVRENILFGLPFEPEKYKRVCRVCALEMDFKQFPYGDQTLVGERGVSLSGGQRARINLARSVYREADIYLLDDPLSAVDANVGRQLFEGCINGYLRGRTRVLVTHQIHFLKAADYIIVLNEGKVENMGTFEELANCKEFSTLLAPLQEGKDDNKSLSSTGGGDQKLTRPQLMHSQSKMSESMDLPEYAAQKQEAEERGSGNLKWSVVAAYFSAGGGFALFLTVVCIFGAAAAAAGADFWVSYWTNQVAIHEEQLAGAELEAGLDVQMGRFTTRTYIIFHGCIVGACLLLTKLRVFPFAHVCVTASANLHNRMFSTMLRGVMRFFDTSSSGRILNRFTKDIGSLDEILPRTLLDVFQIYSTLLAILVLNAVALYWTLVPSAVLLVIFGFAVNVYMKAAQSIKRLEGTTKSPVFGMVTSSLSGIATIRSSGAEQRLIDEFDKHQDLHTYAWNGYLGGGTTFGLYLDTICLVYMTTVIFVFLYIDFGDAVAVGSVGLAVTQSNLLTFILQHGARMLVEFLAQLTSVERVLDYTRIPTEDNLFTGQIDTPPNWPAQGKILLQNVNLRYAKDEEPVLKNLNISIESGWKVGIVGRTGAGKSSLISALFRFAYIDGRILVDDVDTSLVALQELRSKISIIPQEPVLFSASIRYNLDPFDVYSDDELWRALEQVDMKAAVPSLDFKVTEGGANFSVGQRQLVCLARAVLRSNKVLIMDEATANVDPQTDSFIQQTIRRQFASCTVLTIAHRLNTIMDSDRVLVMDAGQVKEFDHPYHLLSDPHSQLTAMVKETSEKMSQQLFEVAKEAYFQSNMKENAR